LNGAGSQLETLPQVHRQVQAPALGRAVSHPIIEDLVAEGGRTATVVAAIPGLAGSIIHDAQTAVLMREHGIRRICTRDTDLTGSRSSRPWTR